MVKSLSDHETYVNDRYGITINYQDGWSYEELSGSNAAEITIVEIVPPLEKDPEILTSVDVGFKSQTNNMKIDHSARIALRSYKEFYKSHFNLISVGDSYQEKSLDIG